MSTTRIILGFQDDAKNANHTREYQEKILEVVRAKQKLIILRLTDKPYPIKG